VWERPVGGVVSESTHAARSGGELRLLLSVEADPEVDSESADRAARQLRAELAELDVDVEVAADATAEERAKGIDPGSLTAIVVALSASGGVFAAVINTVRDWLGRHTADHRISVTIDGDTIELDRATADQQRQLVDAYIERHSSG
jgi:Effector Associated Constant Component 1